MATNYYTDDELAAALEGAVPPATALNRPDGVFDPAGELSQIQATAAASLLADPDSALYLIKLATLRLSEELMASLAALADIKTALAGTVDQEPAVRKKDWALAHRSARELQESPGNTYTQEALSTSLDAVTRQLGAAPTRTFTEMETLVEDKLGDVLFRHQQILRVVSQLPEILGDYSSSGLTNVAVRAQATHTQALLDQTARKVVNNETRGTAASLQAAKLLLNRASTALDPTSPKASGNITATGASIPAEVLGTRSAPFRPLATKKTLTVTVDGYPSSWTFPEATPPTIRGKDLDGSITIRSSGTATVTTGSAPDPSGWDVRRVANAGTFQASGFTALCTTGLDPSIQVGDSLWIDSKLVRIEAIEGDVVVLDTEIATPATFTNVACFIDGRLSLLVNGAEYVLDYSPITGATTKITPAQLASFWAGELSGVNVTSTSLTVSVTTVAEGPTASLFVTEGEMYDLLSFGSGTDEDRGQEVNDHFKVKVVTESSPEGSTVDATVTPGSYTASTLASALNGLISGLAAYADGDVLVVATSEVGSLAEVTLLEVDDAAYETLGLVAGTAARGRDVSMSALLESAPDGFPALPSSVSSEVPNLGTADALTPAGDTLTFSGAGDGLFEQIAEGDILSITFESGEGHYRITGVSQALKQVTVSSDIPPGTYTPRIQRSRLKIASQTEDRTSALNFSLTAGEDVPGLVGIALGETRGSTESLLVGAGPFTDQRPQIKAGDLVVGASEEWEVVEVSEGALKVDPQPDNDVFEAGTVMPLGAVRLDELLSAAADWEASLAAARLADLTQEFLPSLVESLDNKNTAEALETVESYEGQIAALQTALNGVDWDAVRVQSVEMVLSELRTKGLDRAEDLLRQGFLSLFLDLNERTASYKRSGLSAMSELQANLRSPGGADKQLDEVPIYAPDAESDFSDTDDLDVYGPGDS